MMWRTRVFAGIGFSAPAQGSPIATQVDILLILAAGTVIYMKIRLEQLDNLIRIEVII